MMDSDSSNSGSRVTRREAIRLLAAAAVGIPGIRYFFGRAEADTPDTSRGRTAVVAGNVEGVLSGALVVRDSAGALSTVLVDDAEFSRGAEGAVGSHQSFEEGDEVVVDGWTDGSVVYATAVSTMYRPLEGRVLSRQGTRLETDGGTIYIVPGTRGRGHAGSYRAADPEEIGEGDSIGGLVYRSPELPNGGYAAAVLGVR